MPLHDVFAAAVETARREERPGLSSGSIAEARAIVDNPALAPGDGIASVTSTEIDIPTRAGRLPARFCHPGPGARGIVIYFHGGGWVAGSARGFDALGQTLAVRSGCAVLLVDYRLAPEHPFPCALEDAEDAVRWVAGRPDALATGGKIVLAGDSAGGNLAAVTALALRDEIAIALQVLFYPVTDCDFGTPSYRAHGVGLPLTRKDMEWFFRHYAAESAWTDPRISPLRADVTGAPPAWVGVAEYDVLLSEGQAFAERLGNAGIPVEIRCYEGLPHGFARWFGLVDTADSALDDAAGAIRAACLRDGVGTRHIPVA